MLSRFAAWGAGFDVVSGGELARVERAGGQPRRTVFAGVGKTKGELEAALGSGVLLFNVESAEELELLDQVARAAGVRAPFAIRVNPDVDARTHRSISTGLKTSKFGVPLAEARALYQRSRQLRGLLARGVDCHIGSQLTRVRPLAQAVRRVAALYRQLAAEGHPLGLLDVGGGLGIRYRSEISAGARGLGQGAAGGHGGHRCHPGGGARPGAGGQCRRAAHPRAVPKARTRIGASSWWTQG